VTAERPDAATLDHAGRAIWLRRDAERIGGSLPPLLAEALALATAVSPGLHGRRKAGPGESFWQFRQALPGDAAAAVDWRRSARSDALFIRDREWEAAQNVGFWSDNSRAMDYKGPAARFSKRERAALLSLALARLLSQAGERFVLCGAGDPAPRTGEAQLQRMALALSEGDPSPQDYGIPPRIGLRPGSQVVFLSDFLGDRDRLAEAFARTSDAGLRGTLLQVLDPSEASFPFGGRVRFESMAGSLFYQAERAESLVRDYRRRLSERQDWLAATARRTGWHFRPHLTGESPRPALIWLCGAVGGGAGGGG
jgi:uncharacterized protein (DUF58 family)